MNIRNPGHVVQMQIRGIINIDLLTVDKDRLYIVAIYESVIRKSKGGGLSLPPSLSLSSLYSRIKAGRTIAHKSRPSNLAYR